MQDQLTKIRKVKEKHESQWMAISQVQAVGIGILKNGETGILISVDQFDANLASRFPLEIEGVFLEVVESGTFRVL
ncbi:MAG: hypothetical protein H6696_07130 [Deferribacteres bacterium]|nr:hypothetical protein [candidate division KSB1 bacterium]MCB9501695.1 hypothetical protein [Deferribacteres bacterium]